MIGIPPTGNLEKVLIGGHFRHGPIITSKESGVPLRLAVIGPDGAIIEEGQSVAIELWNVAIATYKNFMRGQGHLIVYTEPPSLK